MAQNLSRSTARAALARAVSRRPALRVVGRLALLLTAAWLASGALISLALTDCAWGRGGLCGGDIDQFFEGYATGTALAAAAAALAVRAVTRRPTAVLAAAVAGVGAAVLFAVYLERAN